MKDYEAQLAELVTGGVPQEIAVIRLGGGAVMQVSGLAACLMRVSWDSCAKAIEEAAVLEPDAVTRESMKDLASTARLLGETSTRLSKKVDIDNLTHQLGRAQEEA